MRSAASSTSRPSSATAASAASSALLADLLRRTLRRRRRRAMRRTSRRAGRGRARRPCARAPARSTTPSRCDTQGLRAARARRARRRRSRRGSPRPRARSPTSRPCARARCARAAPEPRLARLARQPQRLVVHPREHEHAAVARVLHDRRPKLRLHREGARRGRAARRAARRAAPARSCRIDASSAACETPSASAMCCALPAPPEAMTGSETASRSTLELLEVVAVLRAVAVDRRDEQLARAALLALARPLDRVACGVARRGVRAHAAAFGVDRDDDRLAAERAGELLDQLRAARARRS